MAGRAAACCKLSVAPMMDYSVPQFRYFMRLVSQQTLLYTEMHVVNALIHMDGPKLRRALGRRRDNVNRVALQIGGSDVDLTREAACRVWRDGYSFQEVNINCGCPSEKVSGAGMFGAALMDFPEQVAALARAASDGVAAGTASHASSERNHAGAAAEPAVTVKCRIGIARPADFEDAGCNWKAPVVDDEDYHHHHQQQQQQQQSRRRLSDPSVSKMLQYFRGEAPPSFTERRHNEQFEKLCGFVETVSRESPVTHFIVHAREAALDCNFDPKNNRSVPPLRYDVAQFPHLTFAINGGIAHHDDVLRHLGDPRHPAASDGLASPLDSVMVGRAVLNDSFFLRGVDETVFGVQGLTDGSTEAHPTLSSVDSSVAEGDVFRNFDIDFRVRTLQRYAAYCDQMMDSAGPAFASRAFRWSLKPLLSAFNNVPRSKFYRRVVSDAAGKFGKDECDPVPFSAFVDEAIESMLAALEDHHHHVLQNEHA